MAKKPENRDGTGRFKPGASGNPGGRPRDVHGIAELSRAEGPACLEKLIALRESADERVALAACNSILDRGFGKPVQALEHSGDVASPPAWSDNDFARRVAFVLTKGLRDQKEPGQGGGP